MQRQAALVQLPLLQLSTAVLQVDSDRPAVHKLQHDMAMDIATQQLKTLYHHLGAGPELAHAALRLLTAATRQSAAVASRLVDGFDFGLKALSVLGRLPKYVDDAAMPMHPQPTQIWTA